MRAIVRGLVVGFCFSLVAGGASLAPAADPADSTATEPGDSYWGPIEDPTADNTEQIEQAKSPAWATIIDVPFVILAIPFKLISAGIEWGVDIPGEKPLFPIALFGGTALGAPSISYGTTKGVGLKLPVIGTWGSTDMRFVIGSTTRTRDTRATLGFKYTGSSHSAFEYGGGYRRKLNTLFYGLGPNSLVANKSFYLRRTTWAGASYERRHRNLNASWIARANYTEVNATIGDKTDDPQLDDVFAGMEPPGFGEDSKGVDVSFDIAHDDTPGNGRPNGGGVRRGRISWFGATDASDVQFWQYRVEAQQFVPLWHSFRTLALRSYLTRMESVGDAPIPFQRIMTNDDPDLFRGFQDNRFYDVGMLSLNVEYRWPLWVLETEEGLGVDLLGLFDYAQVFHEYNQISTANMTRSIGFGFRAMTARGFMGRMEFAWSDEGFQLELSADQLFQSPRLSLLRGNNPVPER